MFYFLQVSVVKPGMPFQVVANFQSKRKTPTMLSFYQGERGFGADAEALLGRKPHLVVAAPQTLLGRNATHPLADGYVGSPFNAVRTATNGRGGFDFVLPNEGMGASTASPEAVYSAEELSAMLLAHARDFASAAAGQAIVDTVITVPSFASQGERAALSAAAELAGLKVLSLVEENTAAAVHHSIDKMPGEGKQDLLLIFNMGATSTQVSARG